MSASTEALALVALVANGPKYAERLQELAAATAASDKAARDLQAAEKSSAEKLAVTEALHVSLQGQVDEIQAANAVATAKIEASRNDLARREAAFDEAKQAHADQVEHDLRNCAFREEAIARKEAELGAVAEARVKDLHAGQAALRDQHKVLHATIAEARQGIAAIAA
jgi:hypothetical protein